MKALSRKHHDQQELFRPPRGGKRQGAGRPCKGARPGEPHKRRPTLKASEPVHVVLRVTRAIANLRKRHMYRALREATFTMARREIAYRANGPCRIVHLSIQRTHIHLLVEASDRMALSRGMQSFQISAARHLNRAAGRSGNVFPDRFHQEIIRTPTGARNAIRYVLNNWRKHGEDAQREWNVDPFSSGVFFTGWSEDAERTTLRRWPRTYEPLIVYQPRTWLLREGWRSRGGGEIGHRDAPARR